MWIGKVWAHELSHAPTCKIKFWCILKKSYTLKNCSNLFVFSYSNIDWFSQTLIDFQIACENKLQIGQVLMFFPYLKPYCCQFTIMVSTYCCVQMFLICMDNHCVSNKTNHTHIKDDLANYFLLPPFLNKLFNLGAKSFSLPSILLHTLHLILLHLTICPYNKSNPWELGIPHILEYPLAKDLNNLKQCLLARGRQCWMKNKRMWKESLESKIVWGGSKDLP
jgi:hypothetical protein